ncbi:MAG: phosphoenolpyruvate carboxykinase (ATP), partial [Poseidonia sp.]
MVHSRTLKGSPYAVGDSPTTCKMLRLNLVLVVIPSQKGQRGAAETLGMGGVHGTPSGDLAKHGISPSGDVYWNLSAKELIDLAVARGEGVLSAHGALVTETGERTGRSPNDKFIVDEPSISEDVNWGDVNVSTDLATFERMRAQVVEYLSNQDSLFVQDLYCGADFSEALPIRVINHNAWHNTFARNMFIRPETAQLEKHAPEFTVLHAPHFEADAEKDGLNSQCFVIVNYAAKEVIIGGTR